MGTAVPAKSALTGGGVTQGGFKTALDQLVDAVEERLPGVSASKGGGYTLAVSEQGETHVVTAAGTINLPAVASATSGFWFRVRNESTGLVTLDPSGAETIDNRTSFPILPGHLITVFTDGVEWFTVSLGYTPLGFRAKVGAQIPNVTGAGGAYTIVFDTEEASAGTADPYACYNNATGVFTVPTGCAGWYVITTNVWAQGLAAGNTDGVININLSVHQSITIYDGNIGAARNTSNQVRVAGSTVAYLDAAETVSISITVSGGTAVVDIGSNSHFAVVRCG